MATELSLATWPSEGQTAAAKGVSPGPGTSGPTQTVSQTVQWLANDLFVHADQIALVLSVTSLNPSLFSPSSASAVTFLSLRELDRSKAGESTSFPAGTFERIYLHRVIGNVPDTALLAHVGKLLRPGGQLIALATAADFSFAPLPDQGDVHLIRRTLASSGFDEVKLAHRTAEFFAVTARRKIGSSHSK